MIGFGRNLSPGVWLRLRERSWVDGIGLRFACVPLSPSRHRSLFSDASYEKIDSPTGLLLLHRMPCGSYRGVSLDCFNTESVRAASAHAAHIAKRRKTARVLPLVGSWVGVINPTASEPSLARQR
jgi:hypothetical protein